MKAKPEKYICPDCGGRKGHGANRCRPCATLLRQRPTPVGTRFGRLVLLEEIAPLPQNGHRRGLFQCDCGQTTETPLYSVWYGQESCGCISDERIAVLNLSHGEARRGQQTPEHVAWMAMKQRCYYEKHIEFEHYGGRGIRVCDEWVNDYPAFLAYVGRRPSPNHSLDRYPNKDGNYEPGNVRWATQSQQMRNTRINMPLTIGDETRLLTEWSEISDIPAELIRSRLRNRKTSVYDAVVSTSKVISR